MTDIAFDASMTVSSEPYLDKALVTYVGLGYQYVPAVSLIMSLLHRSS